MTLADDEAGDPEVIAYWPDEWTDDDWAAQPDAVVARLANRYPGGMRELMRREIERIERTLPPLP